MKLAQLIDKRRDLAAQIAGVDLEIAMAVNDREAAQRAMQEMYAQVNARIAAKHAPCFFVTQGDADKVKFSA